MLDNDATGAQTEKHQKRMMGEIAKLLDQAGKGRLDPADYERTVATLLASGRRRAGDHQEARGRLEPRGRRREDVMRIATTVNVPVLSGGLLRDALFERSSG